MLAQAKQGLKDAYEMRDLTASKFELAPHYLAVASTGVIGEYMKMDKIKRGIELLEPSPADKDAIDFEQAILTTDTVTKNCAYSVEIDGVTVTMGGAAKGSGMIHPNMATMLGFITTDAALSQAIYSLHFQP